MIAGIIRDGKKLWSRSPPLAKTLYILDIAGMFVVLSIPSMNFYLIGTIAAATLALMVASPVMFYYWYSWERKGVDE